MSSPQDDLAEEPSEEPEDFFEEHQPEPEPLHGNVRDEGPRDAKKKKKKVRPGTGGFPADCCCVSRKWK